MNTILSSIEYAIGGTPLVALRRLGAGLPVRLLAKLESFNPAGSAKDRIARAMLDDAEARGVLCPGGVIIEPTSGNTGVALAALAAVRGYRCILVMPDSMSMERQQLLRAYGAELVLTPGGSGMAGAVAEAERLAQTIPGSFIPNQFQNPANPAAHYRTTGPEILAAAGNVDIFVAGVGTGGTLTGAGRYLKERDPGLTVVAVEPADSPLLSRGTPGPHGLQGIGPNFLPEILDPALIDRVEAVTQEQAQTACRALARQEGILAGISSGAALHAAMALAREPENAGSTIVVLLPDSGERYLSTSLFSPEG